MNDRIHQSIIDTLSYFDIFNYPLTLKELGYYLHYHKISLNILKVRIEEIPVVKQRSGLYYLADRTNIVSRRKVLKKINLNKMKVIESQLYFLKKVPGVLLIAVSGSLSMNNANQNDDIDLFIVTKKNMLWISRIIIIMYTKIIGIKREYKSKNNENKFCLNMFMEESNMEFDNKNLYIAHEMMQMKILEDKANIYNKMLLSNNWVERFLPNSTRRVFSKKLDESIKKDQKESSGLYFINYIFFILQFIYMSKKITREKVALGRAFFHPNDYSELILKEHKKRKKLYLEAHFGIKDANKVDLNAKWSIQQN